MFCGARGAWHRAGWQAFRGGIALAAKAVAPGQENRLIEKAYR